VVALVQSKEATSGGTSTLAVVLDAAPIVGNILFGAFAMRAGYQGVPSGWTQLFKAPTVAADGNSGNNLVVGYKIAGSSESATQTWQVGSGNNTCRATIAEFSGVSSYDSLASLTAQAGATSHTVGPLTPTAGVPAALFGVIVKNDNNESVLSGGTGGWTTLASGAMPTGNGPQYIVQYQIVNPTSGGYSMTATEPRSDVWVAAIAAAVGAAIPIPKSQSLVLA
jgi:hypothetical protein